MKIKIGDKIECVKCGKEAIATREGQRYCSHQCYINTPFVLKCKEKRKPVL